MSETESRVYIVYQDYDGGKAQHVVAKNRKDAYKKVEFKATHVSYRPWLKFIDGKFLDRFGNEAKL